MSKKLTIQWVARVVATLVFLALSWALMVGWFLPRWAKPQVESLASQSLGVPVTVGGLAAQPWSLTVSVQDVTVGAKQAPLLRLPSAQIQMSLESIWRGAPVIRRLTLTQPQVWIERQTEQTFNVTELLRHVQSQPSKPSASPVMFAVHNIRVNGGELRFSDRVLHQEHRIEALNLGVPFISNLPSAVEVDVEPLLEAKVDGSVVQLTGRTRPFSQARRSTVDVTWRDIDLASWMQAARPLLPPDLQLTVSKGRLSSRWSVQFESGVKASVAPKLLIRGEMHMTDLALKWPEQAIQTGWSDFSVEGLELKPFEKVVVLDRVALKGLWVNSTGGLRRPAPQAPAPSNLASPETPAWSWAMGHALVESTGLRLKSPEGVDLPELGPWSLKVDGLSSSPKAVAAKLDFHASDRSGGRLNVTGGLSAAKQEAQVSVGVQEWQPAPWLSALTAGKPLPIKVLSGKVSMDARMHLNRESLGVEQGMLRLSEVKMGASQPGFSYQLQWGEMDLQGLQAQFAFAQKASSAPVIKLAQLRCQSCAVTVHDQSVTPAVRWSLQNMQLALSDISSDPAQKMGFELDALGQGKGQIHLKGDVRRQPLALQSRIDVAGLDLRAAQSYAAPYVNIALVDAKLHGHGHLVIESSAGAQGSVGPSFSGRYQGRLGLSDVRAQDSVTQADFLRWKSLSLDGLDLKSTSGTIDADLGRIELADFYGRVIINPNGQLNLAELIKQEHGEQDKSLTTPQNTSTVPAVKVSQNKATTAMKLRWQGIRLNKGRVDFTDTFIKPNYSARLTKIQGDVSAVSSAQPEPATVQISGAVDDSAPLQISGKLHPLGPRLYTDLRGQAKGIELTRLTPYAARYAGYAIEKGSLSVSVHYKVDQGKLEADNQVFLDQLTFGDKVDSPDATSLPVRFAVSLLKNNRGEIDVRLPVSGSLDDPQFSVGGIIWRVVVNLVTKAVTAPFSLLSGGSSEELGFVAFQPGADELTEAARQSLDALIAKLSEHPDVKLEATGRVDPALDEEGLRQRHVTRLMRLAKAKASDQALELVTIQPQEHDRWIEAAYKAADIKKPRNTLGLPKTLPVSEMQSLLKAATAVDSSALMTLANRRGDRVKAYLVAKLPTERVLLTASKLGVEGLPDDKGPTTRVQFALK